MRATRYIIALPLAVLTFSGSCVDTRKPPQPPLQVDVPYGPKIYLNDATSGTIKEHCRFMGALTLTTTGTSTQRKIGNENVTNIAEAVNCYVEVAEGALEVDTIEVTNELFQLCVDSGVCKVPNPSSVEKNQVCSDVERFDQCPVLRVPQFEAQRFCEFIGRRLPSGVEHIIMRQQNKPQKPEDVQTYATGNAAPSGCPSGVLKGCNGPLPMTVTGDETKGAATADRTSQGVYDLVGNGSEWTSDLLPPFRGNLGDYPWFCQQRLKDLGVCPAGSVCIRGAYDPDAAGPLPHRDDWPLCVASPTLQISSGTQGSAMGGNFNASGPLPHESGLFVRKNISEPDSEAKPDSTVTIRCVGESGRPAPILGRVMPDAGPLDIGPIPDTGSRPDGGPADLGFADTGTRTSTSADGG